MGVFTSRAEVRAPAIATGNPSAGSRLQPVQHRLLHHRSWPVLKSVCVSMSEILALRESSHVEFVCR